MNARLFGIGLIVALTVAGARAAETLEDVEKKLIDTVAKMDSISFAMTGKTEMAIGGMSTKMDTKGTCEVMRKGNKVMWRSENTMKTVIGSGDQVTKTDQVVTTVDDGQALYVQTKGQPTIMKMPRSGCPMYLDVKCMLDQMRKTYEMKLVGSEKVDGRDTWVIEATPKKGTAAAEAATAAATGKSVSYYDKQTGLAIKSVGYDKDGKVQNSMNVTDVKVNPKLDEKRFKLEGEITDMTKAPGMGGGEEKDAKDAKGDKK